METRFIVGAAILAVVALEGLRIMWLGFATRRRRRRLANKTDYIYLKGATEGVPETAD